MTWGRVLALVASLTSACGGASGLEVDVRTDLVPIDEMASVWLVVTLVDGSGEPIERTYEVTEADDFLGGVRVASLSDVPHGELRIDVEVRDALGRVVLQRPTLVTLENDRAVTVLLTRDCRGVTCGDAGAPLACLAGTCTDPRCTPETPELCSAMECVADADCTFAAECAVGRCSNGVCLAQADDALCEDALWCNPDEGCVDLPPLCPELEVVEVAERMIVGGATWPAAEYVLAADLSVRDGPLVVAPCSVIRASTTIEARDGGGLTFEGASRMPITVTSVRQRPSRGDWNRILILDSAASADNVFQNVVVEYGGGTGSMIRIERGASIEIRDSTLRESDGPAIEVLDTGRLVAFENNRVVDNASGVHVSPGALGSLGAGEYGPNDLEGLRVNGGAVDADAIWLAHGVPYVFEGDVSLTAVAGSSARVTVEAGGVVSLASGRRVTVGVNGGLALVGTAEAPVTVTSASPGPSRGDWANLFFRDGSIASANRFTHAVVEYGGSTVFGMVEVDSGAALSITDSTLRSSGTEALVVNRGGALDVFADNAVMDNGSYGVEVAADMVGALGPGAYGPNDVEGISITAGSTERDATWSLTGVPYVLTGDMRVEGTASAILSIGPGVELRMTSARQISVDTNGGLELMGEVASPVLITSSRPAPAAGDWSHVRIFRTSLGPRNVLRNARIEYGGGSVFGQLWVESMAQVELENLTFANPGMGCDVDSTPTSVVTADAASSFVACP